MVAVKQVFLKDLGADFRIAGGNRIVNESTISGASAPTAPPPEVGKVWQWVNTTTKKLTHYWDAVALAWVAYAVDAPVEETVEVAGATLPISFPVATLPGAPVFTPNTPAAADKLYVFPNGQTAVWNGTQYTSYVAPGRDYFSNVTATANTLSPPDGVNDLTEAIRREGFIGVQNDPTSTFHGRTLALNGQNSAVGTQSANDFSRIILTTTSFTLLDPNLYPGRIIMLVNSNSVPVTLTGAHQYLNHLVSSAVLQSTIPAKTCVTLQSIYNSVLPPAQYWQLVDIGSMPATTPDDVVDVTGATLPIAFPVATIPGTPVFAPNTPAAANTLYVFPNGQTAVWNGTQYTSYVAPGRDYFSNVTATANTLSPPDGVNDLTESIRRDGAIGINTAPNTHLDIMGSHGFEVRWVNGAGAGVPVDVVVTQKDSMIEVGGNGGTLWNVPLPAAAAFRRRILTLRVTSETANINVTSLGGRVESPNYTQIGASVLINGKAMVSVTWQSDGDDWRILDWTERKYYPTTGYTVPAGASTINGFALPANASGVPLQLPTFTTLRMTDGNFANPIALPATNNATGRISVYNDATFTTNIASVNTDLPILSPITTGHSMHFEWSNSAWRWVPSPDAQPVTSLNEIEKNAPNNYTIPGPVVINGVATIESIILVTTPSTIILPVLPNAAPYRGMGIHVKTINGTPAGWTGAITVAAQNPTLIDSAATDTWTKAAATGANSHPSRTYTWTGTRYIIT